MDRLQAIFNRQADLMDTYEGIERARGFHAESSSPWSQGLDLNNRFDQARIKDTAWRMTEELGESLDAIGTASFQEELIDVLHFLVELTILSGMKFKDILHNIDADDHLENLCFFSRVSYRGIRDHKSEVMVRSYQVICSLSMACNVLKNKPWKQTPKDTDVNLYHRRIRGVWYDFFRLLSICQMNSNLIFEAYFHKSDKNKDRQATGY